MKTRIISSFFLLFISMSMLSFAQDVQVDPNKPDEELKRDEADVRIKQLQQNVAELQVKLDKLNVDYKGSQNELSDLQAAIKKCEDDLLQLIGATQMDIDNFRQRLGVIEGQIREMSRLSDDVLADRRADVQSLENRLNMMRKEKIAVLPEFYDRIMADARDIKGLYREKKIKGYTVRSWKENRDCLWNIAGNSEIYNDPFQWPKLWQANTDQITNPDIIHPGQVLQVPPAGPKTTEEMKAERMYWRKKHVAVEKKENMNNTPSVTPAPANTNTGNSSSGKKSGAKGE